MGDRLRANLHQYTLRVPFFDRSDAFQFLEPTDNPGSTKIELQTPNGVVAMMGHAREKQRGGGRELTVELRRIAVPLKDGALEIPASSLDLEEGVRFRRDLFGGRRPTQVRRWRSADRLRRLVGKRDFVGSDFHDKQSKAGRTRLPRSRVLENGLHRRLGGSFALPKIPHPNPCSLSPTPYSLSPAS